MIGFGLDDMQREAFSEHVDWDSSNKSEERQILSSITSFDFMTVFVPVYQYLSHVLGITVKLQRSCLEIIDANQQIQEVKDIYQYERENVGKEEG